MKYELKNKNRAKELLERIEQRHKLNCYDEEDYDKFHSFVSFSIESTDNERLLLNDYIRGLDALCLLLTL